jgi:hypothetical protein
MEGILYVSAFTDIRRDQWNNRFQCQKNNYTLYIQQLLDKTKHCVVYCDGELYQILKPLYGDKVLPYNRDDTYFKLIEREGQIMKDDSFRDLTSHQTELPERNYPEYTIVNHNKVHFIDRAKKEFPGYMAYAWIDIHYYRHNDTVSIYDASWLPDNKITIGSFKQPFELFGYSDIDIIKSSFDHIQGSVFIVPKKMVEELYAEYTNQLQILHSKTMTDDDQGIHFCIFQRRPELYNILDTGNWGQFFWTCQLKQGILGHR